MISDKFLVWWSQAKTWLREYWPWIIFPVGLFMLLSRVQRIKFSKPSQEGTISPSAEVEALAEHLEGEVVLEHRTAEQKKKAEKEFLQEQVQLKNDTTESVADWFDKLR